MHRSCRASQGDIRFAAMGKISQVTDAFHAEALSHTIQVADQLGVGRVIFKTNCINLIMILVLLAFQLRI